MTLNKMFVPRFPESARLSVLQDTPARDQMAAQVVHGNGKVLRLFVAASLHRDTQVRIDVPGGTVIGHVSACTPENSGFGVTVQIEQVNQAISDLSRLFHAIQGPVPPVSPVAETPAPAAQEELQPVAVKVPRSSPR